MTSTFAGLPLIGLEDSPPDYLSCLILGPNGAGKSTLASSIATLGRTLYIDLIGEKGTQSIRGWPWSDNIVPIRPDTVTALDDIFWALDGGDHDFDAVVVDSITAVQKMTMRFLAGHKETAVREIQRGSGGTDLQMWGRSLDVMTDLATFWHGLADGDRPHPMHVVMIAQTKTTITDDGMLTRQPDVQKGALSVTQATPDLVLYCDIEEDPEAVDDDGEPILRHIVRCGNDPAFRTKARLPAHLIGKIPSVLGRKRQLTLGALARKLQMGGIPQTSAGKTGGNPEKEKEQ